MSSQQTLHSHSPSFPVSVHNMTVAYGRRPVLWDIDLDLEEGKITGIVGPNGAGKSTFIKAVLDLLPKATGQVRIYGEEFRRMRQLVAYVPQRETVDWDFPISALEVVVMGRYGLLGWFRRPRRADYDAARAALKHVGMDAYADRQISQLSGGQQQRVFLARALVQEAKIYFLDEPFAGVDAATEAAIIQLLGEMRARGNTVVVVHHDLQTVRSYFDNLLMLNMRLVAYGPTEQVFTEENLRQTYGGRLTVLDQAAHAVEKDVKK